MIEIMVASEVQTSGAAQINRAMDQLNDGIQGNAMTAERLAATATELNSQAESLNRFLERFRSA